MCNKIGKVRADGSVLFISLNYGVDFEGNKSTLLRFYTREKRLDALLALGNLISLAPSPYHKHKGDRPIRDRVNCRAEIRDDFESKRKHQAKECENEDVFAKIYGPAYLWKEGVWYYISENECVKLAEKTIVKPKSPDSLSDCKVRHIDRDGEYQTYYKEKLENLSDVQRAADSEKFIFFIFRKSKLVKTIHPQIQTT